MEKRKSRQYLRTCDREKPEVDVTLLHVKYEKQYDRRYANFPRGRGSKTYQRTQLVESDNVDRRWIYNIKNITRVNELSENARKWRNADDG